jgi:hypothetical protein
MALVAEFFLAWMTSNLRSMLIHDALCQQPFEPFRLVLTDSVGYDVRHSELMMVGQSARWWD